MGFEPTTSSSLFLFLNRKIPRRRYNLAALTGRRYKPTPSNQQLSHNGFSEGPLQQVAQKGLDIYIIMQSLEDYSNSYAN